MKITLTPMRYDADLTLAVHGDVLTINGEDFDFSALPEGGLLPREAVASTWLCSDIERKGGEIELTILLPHGAKAPQETLFPAALNITTDGAVILPPYFEEEEEGV